MLRLLPRHLLATLALVVLAAPSAAHAGYDESTAYQINPGHTAFASGGSLERPPLQQRWSRTLGTRTSYPLVAGGRVHLIAYDGQHAGGTLYALDSATGSTVWARPVTGYAEIAYDSGRIFIAEETGNVVAVGADTGETKWIRTLPEPFDLEMPVAAGGKVYVSSAWSGGSIYALDAVDGSTTWSAGFYSGGSPAVDGTYVYASDDYQGETVAFSRANGRRAWRGSQECFVASGRIVVDGARVIGPYNSGCGAVVDAGSGRQLDSIASTGGPASAGDATVVLNGSTLQARSLSMGTLSWQFAGDGRLRSAPVIVNETVYVGSASGTLFAVDLRTGMQLWSGSIAPDLTVAGAAGIAAGGGLLVVPAGGTVTALESVRAPRPGLDLRIGAGPDGPTMSRSATLSFGSSDALALQTCRLDRGAWTACMGSATYSDLAEGPHMFEVRTQDAADGATIALAARGWSVDTTVADATITSGPSGPTTSIDAVFRVDIPADPSARTECQLDRRGWTPCDDAEAWETYDASEYHDLAQGPHLFEARARDALGNAQSPPAARSWTVDSKAPRTTIHSGPEGPTAVREATFTFSADEPATYRCAMDYAPLAACQSPYVMSGIADGTHTFRVVATDAVGHVEAYSGTRTWTVGPPSSDTLAPDTRVTAAPPLVTAGTSARFVFDSNEYGASFACQLDGGGWTACSSPKDITGLADGEHQLDVRARDAAGNVDQTPASWRWTVDTLPPTSSATLADTSNRSVGWRFILEADEPATFECALDDGSWMPCATNVTYDRLADGVHEFRLRASDAAGNREPQPVTVAFTIADAPAGPPPVEPPPAEPPPVEAPPAEAPQDTTLATTTPATTPAGATPTPAAATGAVPAFTAPAPRPAGTSTSQRQLEMPSLARALARAGAAVLRRSTRRQMRAGVKVRVHSGVASTVTLKVLAHRDGRSLTVARARIRFTAAGARTVRLRLTHVGRRTLRRQGRVTLRVRATVAPALGAPASASVSVRA
jgi:outer membrane protein assembly factor BamB